SYAPELWRLKGELLEEQAERNRPETVAQAEACFQRALGLAGAAKARSLELRAATSLARLWKRGGRTAEAGRLPGNVCKPFGPGAGSADLVEARALLRALTTG